MAQGDTTVRIDFEVGGANDAKMRILDIYNASKKKQEELSTAAKAFAQANGISYGDAMKAIKKYTTEVENAARAQARLDAKPKPLTEEEKNQLKAQKQLEAEKRFWQRKNLVESHNDQRRAIRDELMEKKRALREEERERRRIRRQEEIEARRAGGRGLGERLLGRTGNAMLMGIAGYAGVAGLSSAISSIASSVQEIASTQSELERAITPLLSLGDNVNKMGQMRTEVIGIAASMGIANQESANFLESIESLSNTMSADTLAELKRESLQLTELTGGELQTNMRMLAKTNEIYGKSFKSIDDAQNKLFRTQQDADVPMEEMAYRMPELMASAKQLGFTFDEVGAGIISATVALGRSEGAFTGFRNVLAAMEESEKKGIKLTGSFADKLDQLKKAADEGKVSLLELFGRDPLAAGGALLDRSETVRQNVQMLSGMSGGQDVVGENLERKYDDERFARARLYQLDKSLMENRANIAAETGADNILTRMHQRYRTGYHAGSAYAGNVPGVSMAAGLAGMFGNDAILEAGEKVRLSYVAESSPLRTDLLRRQFEDKRQRDIDALDLDIRNDITKQVRPGTYKIEDDPRYKAIMSRQFNADQAASMQPSLEKSLDIAAGIDETNKLLRDIRDGKGLATIGKPGGSRSNYEEAI